MDKETYHELFINLCDGVAYDLTEVETYNLVTEIMENVGVDGYKIALIQNTIEYCENYVKEYNETEIKKQIIQNKFIPCFDGLNETSSEIISDLGYEEEE